MKLKFVYIVLAISILSLHSCIEKKSPSSETSIQPQAQIDNNRHKTQPSKIKGKSSGYLSKLILTKRKNKWANIARINNTKFSKNWNSPVQVNGDRIVISGWALDARYKVPANGVYFVAQDGSKYPARYGIESAYLVKQLNNSKFSNAGFEVSIPVSSLGKGRKSLEFRVMSSNGSEYYLQNTLQLIIN